MHLYRIVFLNQNILCTKKKMGEKMSVKHDTRLWYGTGTDAQMLIHFFYTV